MSHGWRPFSFSLCCFYLSYFHKRHPTLADTNCKTQFHRIPFSIACPRRIHTRREIWRDSLRMQCERLPTRRGHPTHRQNLPAGAGKQRCVRIGIYPILLIFWTCDNIILFRIILIWMEMVRFVLFCFHHCPHFCPRVSEWFLRSHVQDRYVCNGRYEGKNWTKDRKEAPEQENVKRNLWEIGHNGDVCNGRYEAHAW